MWICTATCNGLINHCILTTASCAGPTECQDGITNNCTQICTRTVSNGASSYECGCNKGYKLDSDNTTCVGKHASHTNKQGCHHRLWKSCYAIFLTIHAWYICHNKLRSIAVNECKI